MSNENTPTNDENITFQEWLYASGRSDNKFDLGEFRAWKNNEDPAEYRIQRSAE